LIGATAPANGPFAQPLNPLNQVRIRFPWSDANRDTFIQRSELDLTRPQLLAGHYSFQNPGSPTRRTSSIPILATNNVLEVLAPRVVRLGARVTF
jgi:hypothetical protein